MMNDDEDDGRRWKKEMIVRMEERKKERVSECMRSEGMWVNGY